jgi:hypothetical protein
MPLPSEPGMSGGPLIRCRHPHAPLILTGTVPQLYTVVGLVSYGGTNDTWLRPLR